MIDDIIQAIHGEYERGAHRRDLVIMCGRDAWKTIESEIAGKCAASVGNDIKLPLELETLREWVRGEIHGVPVLEERWMRSPSWCVERWRFYSPSAIAARTAEKASAPAGPDPVMLDIAREVAKHGGPVDAIVPHPTSYIARLERAEQRLAELEQNTLPYGTHITHAVLVWNPGEWDRRVVFYESHETACRNYREWMRKNLDKAFGNSAEFGSWSYCEVRDLRLVPQCTTKVEGPEPADATQIGEGHAEQLRELQHRAREAERNQVVVDNSWWDD